MTADEMARGRWAVLRSLTRWPYSMSVDQIAQLTDLQIYQICKEKNDKPEPEGEVVESYQDLFYQTWSERGLSDEQIADKWRHDFPDQADEWHGP